MRLILYNDDRLGVVDDGRVIDVTAAVEGLGYHDGQEMMEMVIRSWEEVGPRIEKAGRSGQGTAVDGVRMGAPVPRPGQLVCLAGNYLEPGKPERGVFNAFLKSPTAVIGCGGTVELPAVAAKYFHFEPELAIVMGKSAARVGRDEAMDCVFGYTQFIDASARGLPGGFFLGKSWHTFGPMGPVLVTSDEVADPNDLQVTMRVNDELRHDFSTSSMDRFIPELLEEVTKVLALEPGDVVSTGTHHYGLAPIEDGDVLHMSIEGFGPVLTVDVHDPLKRTSWASE